MNPDFIALGLVWYVVFLFSTTCHEAAHALVAKWGGDLTAAQGGQITLNPIPHIRREPFGMVLFPLLTYAWQGWMMGWASAPYDPNWSRQNPKRAAKMALAGPAANFALALIAGVAIKIGLWMHAFEVPDQFNFSSIVDAGPGLAEGLARFFSLLFSLNILLGTFNLLPVPPLDGFNAVPVFLSEDGGRHYLSWADSVRAYSFVGILLAWMVFDKVFHPVFVTAVELLYR